MAKLVVTEEYTIPRALKERIKKHPKQLAMVDSNSRLTYAELGEHMDRVSSGLLDLGVKPGEKVALVLPNNNTYPVAMHGIIQMGGVSVGLNPTLKSNEFKHIFIDSEAAAVIVSDSIHGVDPLTIIRELRPNLPTLRHVIVVGDAQENEINYHEMINNTRVRDSFHQGNPNDLAILVYTSGTTGVPKGSMHSHLTALRPVIRGSILPSTPKEIFHLLINFGLMYCLKTIKVLLQPVKVYGSTPPYTAAGMIGIISLNLSGYIGYQMDRYVPSEVIKLVAEEKINAVSFPPAVGALLVKNPDLKKYNLSSLIAVSLGAAPVPPSLVDEFHDKLGVPVAIGYGSSELLDTPSNTLPWRDSKKALRETVGKLNSDYEAKVVDEDRKTLPLGEVGELAVRGKVKMLGYYKAEDLTKSTFDEDGWYFTGDLATIDEEGYLRIVGRVKDMIIRGGQNIYPTEIEDLIDTHPKVKHSSVIGIPDALAGEKVLAYVIPENGSQPTALEILEFCRENMAPYKVPANVYFLDEFPLNATGKVLKRVLREEALNAA